jgi:hypothetical protein
MPAEKAYLHNTVSYFAGLRGLEAGCAVVQAAHGHARCRGTTPGGAAQVGATLNLEYGGRWQLLRCVDPGLSLEASRVMGAHVWARPHTLVPRPLAGGSHIGGVAAGVHPVGRFNVRRTNGDQVLARTQGH